MFLSPLGQILFLLFGAFKAFLPFGAFSSHCVIASPMGMRDDQVIMQHESSRVYDHCEKNEPETDRDT